MQCRQGSMLKIGEATLPNLHSVATLVEAGLGWCRVIIDDSRRYIACYPSVGEKPDPLESLEEQRPLLGCCRSSSATAARGVGRARMLFGPLVFGGRAWEG